ncbi:dihydroorotase [Jannaschia sp. W003]|uniref:dihydroorotase n=1 Tax=Jannaschia sp. W003 TaxID=2867012 RepID=UPI0021A834A2|nr:dihydroorotase [Jannaschia sp. W003]UWQ20947.1 dihydroorotase [Jannaschia sp. W003]
MDTLTIRRPDDWHLHLRDGAMLRTVAPLSAGFGRALVMPNLVPPVTTGAMAAAYRERIRAAGFARPLMTLYLTEETDPADVVRAHADGTIAAVKLYPAGATTNSASGVRDWDRIRPVVDAMEEHGVPLCLHGEVTDPEVDIFDRELRFLDTRLAPLRDMHPGLRITLEHITTADAVSWVLDHGVGATITVQHLMADRNDMLAVGLRPHHYCLPVLKRRRHRDALRHAATSGAKNFFLGTDSAPHPQHAKEAACCAAGCFTAPHALAAYAQVFDEEGALGKLEGFASLHGPAHYRLEPNADTVTLRRGEPLELPAHHGGDPRVVPFDPGHPIRWHVDA